MKTIIKPFSRPLSCFPEFLEMRVFVDVLTSNLCEHQLLHGQRQIHLRITVY